MKLRITALLAIGFALGASSAEAVQGHIIVMMWPGVVGTSTVVGFSGGIDLGSYTQSFLSPLLSTGVPGRQSCGVVTITRSVDQDSTVFLTYGMGYKRIPSLTINFLQTSGATLIDPLKITLINTYVTSVQQGDPSLNGVNETITMQAQEFEITEYPINPNGSLGTPVKFGWNCATDTPVSF